MKKERERIGQFIITSNENIDNNYTICNYCDKIIAETKEDEMAPSLENLLELKNVPIPNFGWFCSQDCGNKYSKKYGVKFQRNINNEIEYY